MNETLEFLKIKKLQLCSYISEYNTETEEFELHVIENTSLDFAIQILEYEIGLNN